MCKNLVNDIGDYRWHINEFHDGPNLDAILENAEEQTKRWVVFGLPEKLRIKDTSKTK